MKKIEIDWFKPHYGFVGFGVALDRYALEDKIFLHFRIGMFGLCVLHISWFEWEEMESTGTTGITTTGYLGMCTKCESKIYSEHSIETIDGRILCSDCWKKEIANEA